MKRVLRLFNQLPDFLPRRCPLCDLRVSQSRALCQACTGDLPWLNNPCSQCGLALGKAEDSYCADCLRDPPAFDHCFAPLVYAPPLDYLIAAFKYRAQLGHGELLADLLIEYLRHCYSQQPWPTRVLPVPLHWRRRLRRGFNQSEILAYRLARQLPIKLDFASCRRLRATAAQQGQTRAQRKHSLRQAFQVQGDFSGQHVAILDDVVTTGSTVNEIAQLLRLAGAARVDIWALARTPSADFSLPQGPL